MISTKRIAQLAKKWQRTEALGRKRLGWGTAAKKADRCCASVASKGHCAVYTTDGARFEVPLACLGTAVFAELLHMSREEFGFAGGHGRILLPCDAMVMEYALCLLRRGASADLEKAFLSTMAMSCHSADHAAAPYVAACC
ncbi:Auxin-responsive protein SAUR36 [Zea mays]|uniref:Auxin-responsive protein SAUR36 n=1 Tax=Zea mays TaxID=4577 RepID=A0A3L6E351_MAIZE|nr:Auxin-responsive protein SAUR36 [Zea mays]